MEKKLAIIDGNSIINRAFYALPPMNNSKGEHTNAIYGFTTMLLSIIDNYEPTHISVAFDKKAPTFRHKMYEDYKAGRKKMPDELAEQLEPLKNFLDKFGIRRFEIEGYEADDIIGTISKKAEEEGYKVYIVTGDKDAIQLASNITTTLITKKGISEVEEYDYNAVIEKYEMTPDQFIDLKGLMGDKSDNIPGVAGIGEKTGIKLIKEFASIENIIENTDKLKGSVKKKIEENKETAIFSKQLATIDRNVPIEFDLEQMIFGDFDLSELLDKLKYFGFNSLINRVMKLKGEEIEVRQFKAKKLEAEEIKPFIEKIKETNKLMLKITSKTGNILEKNIVYMFMSIDKDNFYYVEENEIVKLKEILESYEVKKYGYNLKEDYISLRPYGIEIENMYFDISIAEYLIDSTSSTSYDCSAIAMKYLSKSVKSKEELLGKGAKAISYNELEFGDLENYVGSVFDTIENVVPKMEEELISTKMDGLFHHVEMPLVEVLGDMEFIGVKVDVDKLKELGTIFKENLKNLEEEIYSYSDGKFNINSPKQLGVVLFEKLELPVIKKTKTGYSTNADVLDKLKDKHPIIEKILEYRTVSKLNSTYIEGLLSIINPISNRIHSSFNQTITTTGRISSTEPNLQNIPVRMEMGREIRKVFVAESGKKFVDADYSQVELRVLAHMSEDPNMIKAFENNEDIHTTTAARVFNIDLKDVTSQQRSAAKAVNFGVIYGKTDFGLAEDLNISVPKAKEYIESYFHKYSNIKGFMDDVIEKATEDGFVTTVLNRRRYIPEIRSKNFVERNRGKRFAMNAPIQGSAADIIKIAMANVYKRLKEEELESKLILQVHDELIVETVESEVDTVKIIVKEEMENAVQLNVHLDVDLNVGNSWYEAK
ncbi:MAG: DNA polymerase I [Clostridioides sp.]|nr:DNA polymerase I [Clostridioides sp.]